MGCLCSQNEGCNIPKERYCRNTIPILCRCSGRNYGMVRTCYARCSVPHMETGKRVEVTILVYQSFHSDFASLFSQKGHLMLRSAHNSDKWRLNAWLDSFVPLMHQESSSQASPLSPFPRAWIPQSLQPWLPRCGRR